jgi:thiosulfate dehydrogenase [quinone] large subunit
MPGVLSRPAPGGLAGATGRSRGRKQLRGPRRARLAERRDAWALLPLRLFLGAVLIASGARQLANRAFFRASSPASAHAQLQHVHALAHHAAAVGVLLALLELAVGAATLLGLWTRATAAAGVLLSLVLAVTLTRPLSHGTDLVLAFAFTPLLIAGAGPLSVDAIALADARRRLNLPVDPSVIVGFDAVRQLCGAFQDGRCTARRDHRCAPDGCPALALSVAPAAAAEVERRAFLQKAGIAGWAGAAAVVGGGIAALVGRVAPSHAAGRSQASGPSLRPVIPSPSAGGAAPTAAPTGPTAAPTAPAASSPAGSTPAPGAPAASTASGPSSGPASGPAATAPTTAPTTTSPPVTRPAPAPAGFTTLGPTSAVPVGGAAAFTDPSTGDPGFVVQPSAGQFFAFDASCTHEGCPVRYAGTTFTCPCHGAQFDSATGQVLKGPANAPLRRIAVRVIGATLYAS